jgi:hypothetical protein
VLPRAARRDWAGWLPSRCRLSACIQVSARRLRRHVTGRIEQLFWPHAWPAAMGCTLLASLFGNPSPENNDQWTLSIMGSARGATKILHST